MLHLFCRKGELPYTPLVWIGNTPLVYFIGLFGDLCVPIFCFCSGYAQALLYEKEKRQYASQSGIRLIKFLSNYWIILIIFSLIGLLSKCDENIPGTLKDFLGNAFLFRFSYNGAWWFVLTYCFLVLLTPLFIKIVYHLHFLLLLLGSGTLYFVAYLFRFIMPLNITSSVIEWIFTQIILVGTSQLSFIIGMLFYKHQIISKLRMLPFPSVFKNLICSIVPLSMLVIRAIEPSAILAPITGLITLTCLYVADKPVAICNILLFLGHHSTNLWLVHMFFYLTLFKNFVFIANYPILILLLMLLICLSISYVIQFIHKLLLQWLFPQVLSQSNH